MFEFVGPNELSITHGDFPTSVLGPKGMPRGPCEYCFYNILRSRLRKCFADYQTRIHEAGTSLDGLRDMALHTVRRRPWARGMNSASMKYYEELVRSTVGDLLTGLRQREGETVDISRWMTFFG